MDGTAKSYDEAVDLLRKKDEQKKVKTNGRLYH
jgi:hypothetical protein